jgi:adhesin transport system outer membrane protein
MSAIYLPDKFNVQSCQLLPKVKAMVPKPAFVILGVLLVCLQVGPARAEFTTLHQTVGQALNYSPRLKVLEYNRDAVKHELQQSRGEYLPSIDMILGYGTDQHSDRTTRSTGADPSDDDWDARGEASLSLTQKLYDGGEVKNRIAARKALLSSAGHRLFDNAQSIALDAVIAHLDVYRQRELVALAEKNVKIHQDILASLEQLREAGAGSIADVTQVQGRLARAQSSFYNSKADLASVEANYLRVVGSSPQQVSYAGIPRTVPLSLAQALSETETGNPKVLALGADFEESEAREKLAKANYFPKLNLELNTNYQDQVEGAPSWQHSNEAMLRMRWNLFSGWQDKYGIKAATSRKMQSRSNRSEQLVNVLEETTATWAQYQSTKQQGEAYRNAVIYNEKTLDAYLKQFNVSQRSLLDVLDAENEYFQSGGQLLTATVNETIAAYRLLALSGRLQVSESAGSLAEEPEYLKSLRSEISLQKPASSSKVAAVSVPVKKPAALPVDISIQFFLDAWVEAWQSQDLEDYLSYYSPDYVPERGRTLTAWEEFRRKRLSQPEFIRLSLEEIKIENMDGGKRRVQFIQHYQSDIYQDRVRKTLDLEPAADSWLILREVAVPPNS